MPEMDGLELARRIRAEPAIAGTKLVILSSVDSDESRRAFRNLGACAYIVKPAKSGRLFEALARAAASNAPLSSGAPARPQSSPETVCSSGDESLRSHVLIAEDNEVNRLVLGHMIDKTRFDISFAENGKIAYDAYKKGDYDVILMDISMPEMDGYEAAKAIRSFEVETRRPPTPIICLTAHVMSGQRDASIECGMNDYLSKPVKQAELARMLEKWTQNPPHARVAS
jgi:CheY-like chemotaxis protein